MTEMLKKIFLVNKNRFFPLISCKLYYIFADDQPVNILLHVSLAFERQEYRELAAGVMSLNYTTVNSSKYY
jgi:hypothetical protein